MFHSSTYVSVDHSLELVLNILHQFIIVMEEERHGWNVLRKKVVSYAAGK